MTHDAPPGRAPLAIQSIDHGDARAATTALAAKTVYDAGAELTVTGPDFVDSNLVDVSFVSCCGELTFARCDVSGLLMDRPVFPSAALFVESSVRQSLFCDFTFPLIFVRCDLSRVQLAGSFASIVAVDCTIDGFFAGGITASQVAVFGTKPGGSAVNRLFLQRSWIDELLLYNVAGTRVSFAGSVLEQAVIRHSWVPGLDASETWAPYAHICSSFIPEASLRDAKVAGLCARAGFMQRCDISGMDANTFGRPPTNSLHPDLGRLLTVIGAMHPAS